MPDSQISSNSKNMEKFKVIQSIQGLANSFRCTLASGVSREEAIGVLLERFNTHTKKELTKWEDAVRYSRNDITAKEAAGDALETLLIEDVLFEVKEVK